MLPRSSSELAPRLAAHNSRSRISSRVSEPACRLASAADRRPDRLSMLCWYWVRLASSRAMRSRRTLAMGSSDGTMMRLPVAICCISLPVAAAFWPSELCMMAFICAWVIRMGTVSPESEHAQHAVEQHAGGGDDLQVGLVGLLVVHQVHAFLVEVHGADAVALRLGLGLHRPGGFAIGLALAAGAGHAAKQGGVGVVEAVGGAAHGHRGAFHGQQQQQLFVVARLTRLRGKRQVLRL